jgi:glutamate/tyrosine decarboxylase-like PLP-dependent enzyme
VRPVNKIQDLLTTTFKLASEHVANRTHVGPLLPPLALKKKLGLELSSDGRKPEELIEDMKNFLEYSTYTLIPQFQNQLFSGLNPYSLAGEWLTTIINSTMATYEASPVGTLMEKELVGHLNNIVGWNNGDGIMVTGGSNANLVGMLLARNILFPESKQDGSHGLKLTAFVSEESHYSFDKAANLLGIGSRNLIKVDSDDSGRMLVSDLKEKIKASLARGEKPYFIAATAGTTVLGAFDPIFEISAVAKELKLWLHVDGAWGGSALLSKTHCHLIKGLELADSMTWDTHKMLGTGLISSFFLTRHANSLRKSNDSGVGDYIFHETETSSWDTGPSSLQCGRRIDAFKVWLMWRALGDTGLEKLVDTLFANAETAKRLLRAKPELTLIHDPKMLNICFQVKTKNNPSELVKKVREKILQEGLFYVNYSSRRDQTFFRMIIANPDLQEDHTEKLLNRIVEIGRELDQ